jgi:hypothetical protein
MGGQHPVNWALRLIAPLVAVLATVGPAGIAHAAPGPDAAPTGSTLSPDPVPQPTKVAPAKHAVGRVPPRVIVPVTAATIRPLAAAKPAHPVRHAKVAKPARRHTSPPRIVDVVPLRVDVHRGLGAIASDVRNDTQLVLAAAALLAAVTAAVSGAVLAATVRRVA